MTRAEDVVEMRRWQHDELVDEIERQRQEIARLRGALDEWDRVRDRLRELIAGDLLAKAREYDTLVKEMTTKA